MISTGVKLSIGILLHEYSPSGHERGVGHDKERSGGIWHANYQGGEEYFLELDEGVILFPFPVKGDSFLGQVMERSGESAEVWDEFLVEVAESNE